MGTSHVGLYPIMFFCVQNERPTVNPNYGVRYPQHKSLFCFEQLDNGKVGGGIVSKETGVACVGGELKNKKLG